MKNDPMDTKIHIQPPPHFLTILVKNFHTEILLTTHDVEYAADTVRKSGDRNEPGKSFITSFRPETLFFVSFYSDNLVQT